MQERMTHGTYLSPLYLMSAVQYLKNSFWINFWLIAVLLQ